MNKTLLTEPQNSSPILQKDKEAEYHENKKDTKCILYVMGTPIGNLSDLTFRALEILKHVDWIICEDSRQTLKLLQRYGIQKPLLSVPPARERREIPKILYRLAQCKSAALLSDAGTPGISDPGSLIVQSARNNGFPVEPIPGVSALTSAVSVSGLCEDGFIFIGFLHRRKSRIRKELLKCKDTGWPVVFFESQFRIIQTLSIALEVLGKDVFCWIGRELTKKFEEHFSGPLRVILAQLKERKLMGEFTIILKP